jgi:ligand-binding sensor domain-containing protein
MDDDGTMLIGTEGKGAYRIDHNGKYLLNVYEEDDYDSHSLLGNSVHDILCNRDKTFFATYSGGLSFLYRKEMLKMVMLDKLGFSSASAERSVHKIFRDHHGNVWLATNNGIIWRKRSSELWNKVDGITPAEFDALQDDVDGNIWAGSYFAGLYILDASGHILKHFVPGKPGADFPARTIIDMFRDSDGNIWIGVTTTCIAIIGEGIVSFHIP